MYHTTRQLVKLAPLLIGAILTVGMLVFFNLGGVSIRNELVALHLLPQPENLTELYFDTHERLPKSLTEKQSVSFAFVIHNLEATDYQYAYIVAIQSQGMSQIVDRGNILVKDGQYYTKTENFMLKDTAKEQKVVVELTNKGQSIHFWIGKDLS